MGHGERIESSIYGQGPGAGKKDLQKDAKTSKSAIYMPLIVKDTAVGPCVWSHAPCAYTEKDMELLELLSQQFSVAFSNAKLYQEVMHTTEQFAALYKIHERKAQLYPSIVSFLSVAVIRLDGSWIIADADGKIDSFGSFCCDIVGSHSSDVFEPFLPDQIEHGLERPSCKDGTG